MSIETTYRLRTAVDIKVKLEKLLYGLFTRFPPLISISEGIEYRDLVYEFTTRWSYAEEFEETLVSLFDDKQGFIWVDTETSDTVVVSLYNKGKLRNVKEFDKEFLILKGVNNV